MLLLCALTAGSLLPTSPTLLQTLTSPPTDRPMAATTLTWADYDNDGRLDLHVADPNGTDRLFRNVGDGALADVTAESGLAGLASRSAAWADVDGDGDPDLYLSASQGGRFLLNQDGIFEDATALFGLEHAGVDLAASWSDYDGDGRPDLHLVQVGSLGLFHNEGGSFARVDLTELALPTAVVGSTSAVDAPDAPDVPDVPNASPTTTTATGNPSGDRGSRASGGPSGGTLLAPSLGSTGGSSVVATNGAGVAMSAPYCAIGVTDDVTGKCFYASSDPTYGMLAPVSDQLNAVVDQAGNGMFFEYTGTSNGIGLYGRAVGGSFGVTYGPHLFVDRVGGEVGIGTQNPTSELHVSGGTGSATLLVEADTNNSGESNQPQIVLTQDGGGVEGVLGYRDGTNDLTLSNDFGSSALHLMDNGEVQMRNLAGVKSVELDGDEGGAGALRLFDGLGGEGAVLEASDGRGGRLILRPEVDSFATVVIDGKEQDDDGAEMRMGTDFGVTTIVLDAEFNDGGGANVQLRDSSGATQITLNGQSGRTTTRTLSITGGSDIAEPFDVTGDTDPQPGMVVSIDPDAAGALRLASTEYDASVVGVISGAGGIRPGLTLTQEETMLDGRHPVALTGRVYVWVDASTNPVRPGDFLTTSARPGFAMKAADSERRAGAVLGKAMSSLEEGSGLVLLLVNLQ